MNEDDLADYIDKNIANLMDKFIDRYDSAFADFCQEEYYKAYPEELEDETLANKDDKTLLQYQYLQVLQLTEEQRKELAREVTYER